MIRFTTSPRGITCRRGWRAMPDVELTTRDLTEIERAAAEIQVEGKSYPAQLMAATGR